MYQAYGAAYDDSDGTPWRCVKCGVAVRKGMNDPCKCYPKIDKKKK